MCCGVSSQYVTLAKKTAPEQALAHSECIYGEKQHNLPVYAPFKHLTDNFPILDLWHPKLHHSATLHKLHLA